MNPSRATYSPAAFTCSEHRYFPDIAGQAVVARRTRSPKSMTKTMFQRSYPILWSLFSFHGRPAKRAPDLPPWRRQWTFKQLKLLAGLVRGLLQPSYPSLGHGQALDVIAALPGLRNWPEVIAFPDRVAATELDTTSTGRLAFRLKKRFAVHMTPQELLTALSPPGVVVPRRAPHIWPTGPTPGVYVTTSQDAINALLEAYEDATDGALIYAERAGSQWDSSIDLGEYGLWSSGLTGSRAARC